MIYYYMILFSIRRTTIQKSYIAENFFVYGFGFCFFYNPQNEMFIKNKTK